MTSIVFEKRQFSNEQIAEIDSTYLNDYPIVYILYKNKTRPVAYIGQTVQAKRRMRNHLKHAERRKLDTTILIGHEEFNQSATYNIETNLINYFIAENRYQLQNLSQTADYQVHNYYRKDFYHRQLFNEVWNKLQEEKIVLHDLETLENRDIFKLSPYKALSESQLEIKNAILDYCTQNIELDGHHVFLIEGDAGTGKSVVLSSLFNTIQDYANDKFSTLSNTENYLLVNHGEMIKTYHSIANSLPNLKKKNFLKPTSFINQMDKSPSKKADIVLVDEAHLLLSKEDAYNNFNYNNHLEEIIKRSKITVVIFDPKQVLKIKSYWNNNMLQQITKNYKTTNFSLTDQFRIHSSPAIPEWIDHFVNKMLMPLPKQENEKFDLRIFEKSADLKAIVFQKDKEAGLSRIVSTFDYIHKKDGSLYYVDEDGINLPWNITQNSKTWAEESNTIQEVGSIYTIQGFDLNYVGVILGPSISYDEKKDRLVIDTEQYKDTEAFRSRKDLTGTENKAIKEDIILNSINVLMKRGIHGLYIFATDEKLRNRLLSLQKEGMHERPQIK